MSTDVSSVTLTIRGGVGTRPRLCDAKRLGPRDALGAQCAKVGYVQVAAQCLADEVAL